MSREIINAIQKIAGANRDHVVMITGKVVSYDEASATCVVQGQNNVQIPGVNLQGGVCDGLLILPKAGSTVIVMASTYNQYYVMVFSDIDKVVLQAQAQGGGFTVWNQPQGENQTLQLNNGSYGGLVIVDNLVEKINQLETKLTDLAAYVGGLPIPVSGSVSGAAVPANTKGFQITANTVNSDIENVAVTHGI